MSLAPRVSYGQATQPVIEPAAGAPANKPATAYSDMSQAKLTAADLASYKSLCKALKSRGVSDEMGSSISGVGKENWFDGALSVELTEGKNIFQIRWNNEHKPYFGGSILGVHLNETLDEFRKRFPNVKKVTEIVYAAKYDEHWSIYVTTYHGNLIDEIAINNDDYSLTARPR